MPITIRVRYAAGTLRILDAEPTWTFETLKTRIRTLLGIPQDSSLLLAASPGNNEIYLEDSLTLSECDLTHGSMIFMDTSKITNVAPPSGASRGKTIDSQGNLVCKTQMEDPAAFRPGLLSLRAHKMHWTLTDMTELEDKYTYTFKGKEPATSESLSLDFESARRFQSYCGALGFRQPRAGFLFGRFEDVSLAPSASGTKTKKYGETKGTMRVSDFVSEEDEKPEKCVVADCIYEPKQQVENGTDLVVDFESEETLTAIRVAKAMGLQWVGFIFSHPPGRDGFHFSANEVTEAAYACLEATEGQVDSPFTIVKVAPGQDGIQMDAFQLRTTCLKMIINDALLKMPSRPGFFAVDEKYQAVVEAKSAEVIDTDYLIKRTPIKSHSSECSSKFPPRNRHAASDQPNADALRKLLSSQLDNPSQLRKSLKDFHLLMYLTDALGVETVEEIAGNLRTASQEEQVPEGFVLMVREVMNG